MMCGDISFSRGEFLRGKSVSIILLLSSIWGQQAENYVTNCYQTQSFQTRAVRCDSWHLLASPKVRASCLHSRWDVTTDVPVTGHFFTACIRIRMCWWSEMIYEGRRPILNKGIFKESSTVFVAWTRLSHTRPQRWGYLSLVWKLVEPWKIMNDLGRHKSLGTLGWPFNLNSLLFGLHDMHCIFDVFFRNSRCDARPSSVPRLRWKVKVRKASIFLESGESGESWSVLMAAVIEFRQNSGQRQQLMSSRALKGLVSIVVIWGTSGGLCFFVNLEQGLALRAVEDENTEADSWQWGFERFINIFEMVRSVCW